MSMKVVFLKEYGRYVIEGDSKRHLEKYEAFEEVFVPRNLGRTLCHQEISIPAFRKEKNPAYIEAMKLHKAKLKAEKEKKIEAEQKAEEKAKKPKKRKRKKAVSVKAESREMAIMEDEPETEQTSITQEI